MSESEARERYYWSKIRLALKDGNPYLAARCVDSASGDCDCDIGMATRLEERIAKTFTAGCAALGDPAPLDKEQDHE